MTPLTFGRDIICPTCHGKGLILKDTVTCTVCGGSGVLSPQDRFEVGMDASSDAAQGGWTDTERLEAYAAVRHVADRLHQFTTDDVWAELGPDFPVTKGMASVLNTIARKGEIENTGRTVTSARQGEHGHAQRLTVWHSRRVYRAPDATPKESEG